MRWPTITRTNIPGRAIECIATAPAMSSSDAELNEKKIPSHKLATRNSASLPRTWFGYAGSNPRLSNKIDAISLRPME
jgi:hypothetical protein